MSRKWGGKSLQNLSLNSKENMKQQHVASANSPATVLETAVYINVLAHITMYSSCLQPGGQEPRIALPYYPQEAFHKERESVCPMNAAQPGTEHSL